ncbi:hypothetical protein [Salmonirosea aquatica]|uniref:Glycosyltransferase RgtA/B/C/D-like domain-containing protein n=1 Tax=Salmonirosea aquatica TaxID=2654236 RepID=A0A7C9BSF0_9BACT|nr:hypothetical protein [Cytophagaceae bacterium SJW1-29]
MLENLVQAIEGSCGKQTGKFISRPHLSFRLACLCTVLVIVTGGDALISVWSGYAKLAESATWQFLQKQIASPLSALSEYGLFHHTSKMYYRLFPVYLGKLCWGCSLRKLMYFLIGLEYLAGFLFFYFTFKALKPYCENHIALTWLLVGMAFTFLGKIFFWDTYAYFDAFALLFLLMSMKSNNPFLIFSYICLALWTDERSFVASILVGVWWFLDTSSSLHPKTFFRTPLWPLIPQQWAIFLAVTVTISLRWVLSLQFNRPSVASLAQTLAEVKFVLIQQRLVELVPFVTVASFESYWIYIIGTLAILWLYRERWGFILYLMALGASLGISFLVYDMTRSLMYAFPAIFIGIRILARELSPEAFQRMTLYVMLTAVLFPTYYLSHYMWPFFLRILRFE